MRFIPLAAGAGALLVGAWAGMARLGLALPGGLALAEFHGAMMTGGFLGTVIALERAVAIGRWWAYAAPALSALAAGALVAGFPITAAIMFLLAGILLTFNSTFIAARQPALFTIVLAIASACWAAGTLAWMCSSPAADAAGWWLTFLILTIAAERLELSRLLSPPRASQAIFVVIVAVILLGASRNGLAAAAAVPFSGAGLIAAATWLTKYDIALRTIRFGGLARFSAVCILAGYFWMAVAGLLLIVSPASAVFSYDAIVHAIAIGFVLSMIFGHAPIILPAVTGIRVRFHPSAYFSIALLHVSVLLRVVADLIGDVDLRMLSGPATLAALAAYASTLIVVSRKS